MAAGLWATDGVCGRYLERVCPGDSGALMVCHSARATALSGRSALVDYRPILMFAKLRRPGRAKLATGTRRFPTGCSWRGKKQAAVYSL